MSSDRIRIDGKNRKLILKGDCLELLQLCAAMCCREWGIKLSPEEYASGRYRATMLCSLTSNVCDKNVPECINRAYELEKTAEGACVYLGEDNQCLIYQDRPAVCREFTCRGGWLLSNAVSVPNDSTSSETGPEKATISEKEKFIEAVTDDMTFVSHPLLKLHTVFYVKEKGEITFLKEMVGTCGKFYSRDTTRLPGMDDNLLLEFIRLFDSKQTLREIRQRFREQYNFDLPKDEFYEIVWLLNKHNIIIEARNFRGRLAHSGKI